jgi:argininosuccinate lyase
MTNPGSGTRAGGLWGGRFSGGMAPEMVPLNRSLNVDWRLWKEDIRGSRAWARALSGAGVLTESECTELLAGLDAVQEQLEGRFPHEVDDEDIHSLVERLLKESAGAVAGKLHTGRSRNDQVATDFRLWGMAATHRLEGAVADLARALGELAQSSVEIILPGYTHLQQGQPVRAAHWALSHAWPLLRDLDRLRGAREAAGVLPLGSGALAGCPFPVDRLALAEALGFHSVSENSMDAVSDRDWAAELLFATALLGVHISRLSEDLLLFSSKEFAFLRIGDGFSTGSSLMPQKRNPDVAELARGKTGRLVGDLTGFLVLLKGLPTGYNRDLQEDKGIVFDAVDTLELLLPALSGAIRTTVFRPDRIEAARDPELLATDLADLLVRAGVPFREAHDHVGTLVREAEERGIPLNTLPDAVFAEVHPALGNGAARSAFDWEASVEARNVPGGTARISVDGQLATLRTALSTYPVTAGAPEAGSPAHHG